VITDGKNGAYAAVAEEITFCPALPASVVGTAGAGDAFTSAFTSLFATGAPVQEALQFATVNASSVTTFADTQSGLLRMSDLVAAHAAAKDKLPLQSWTST
jgi:ribokinase